MAKIKCKISVRNPRHNVDLKAYKRDGRDGSFVYYGYSDTECRRLRKKLEN